MPAFNDLTGQTYGRLAVLNRGPNQGRQTMWWVRCACGSDPKLVSATHLRQGATKSCGCHTFAEIHGCVGHELYATWNMMMNRCYNTKHDYFDRYGGRGIRVCERWWAIENFIADMPPRPEGMQLERRNNNRGYEPGNVKWATRVENGRNKSNNVIVEYQGRPMSLPEAAERSGIRAGTLHTRIRQGKADIFAPVRLPKSERKI